MHERLILFTYCFAGAQGADIPIYCELPFPWTFIGAKAAASNDSSATLAASGASAGTIFSATAIGDSGDPAVGRGLRPQAPDFIGQRPREPKIGQQAESSQGDERLKDIVMGA